MDELVGALAADAGVAREQIVEACVVGNTAMHHLFLGLPTRPAGRRRRSSPRRAPPWTSVPATSACGLAPGAPGPHAAVHRRVRRRRPRGHGPGAGLDRADGRRGGRGHRDQHRDRAPPAAPADTCRPRRAPPGRPSRAPTSATGCAPAAGAIESVRLERRRRRAHDHRRRAARRHLRLGHRRRGRRAAPDRADQRPRAVPARGARACDEALARASSSSSRPRRDLRHRRRHRHQPGGRQRDPAGQGRDRRRDRHPARGDRARRRTSVDELDRRRRVRHLPEPRERRSRSGCCPRLPHAAVRQVGNAAGRRRQGRPGVAARALPGARIAHRTRYVELTTYPGFQRRFARSMLFPATAPGWELRRHVPGSSARRSTAPASASPRPSRAATRRSSRRWPCARPTAGAALDRRQRGHRTPDREPADLVWLVETVQAGVDRPLCLDSAEPAGARGRPGPDQPDAAHQLHHRRAGPPGRHAAAGRRRAARASSRSPWTRGACRPRSRTGWRSCTSWWPPPAPPGSRTSGVYLDPLVMTVATNTECGGDRPRDDPPGARRVPGRPHLVRPEQRVVRAAGPGPGQPDVPDPGGGGRARHRDPRSARSRAHGGPARDRAPAGPGPALPDLHPGVPGRPPRGRTGPRGARPDRPGRAAQSPGRRPRHIATANRRGLPGGRADDPGTGGSDRRDAGGRRAALARAALDAGTPPLEILEDCRTAMDQVGKQVRGRRVLHPRADPGRRDAPRDLRRGEAAPAGSGCGRWPKARQGRRRHGQGRHPRHRQGHRVLHARRQRLRRSRPGRRRPGRRRSSTRSARSSPRWWR